MCIRDRHREQLRADDYLLVLLRREDDSGREGSKRIAAARNAAQTRVAGGPLVDLAVGRGAREACRVARVNWWGIPSRAFWRNAGDAFRARVVPSAIGAPSARRASEGGVAGQARGQAGDAAPAEVERVQAEALGAGGGGGSAGDARQAEVERVRLGARRARGLGAGEALVAEVGAGEGVGRAVGETGGAGGAGGGEGGAEVWGGAGEGRGGEAGEEQLAI